MMCITMLSMSFYCYKVKGCNIPVKIKYLYSTQSDLYMECVFN